MIKIIAISDLHGYLPANLPTADLLLIAGDICPVTNHDMYYQSNWINNTFKQWLDTLVAKQIILVAGNHDFVLEKAKHAVNIPSLRCRYLQDTGGMVKGLAIYGSPWQPVFYNWAFNLEEPQLAEKWAQIPAATDILLLHGPPHGYGDYVPYRGGAHTGSPSLTRRIEELQPPLVICGHIHYSHGLYTIGKSLVVNCAIMDEQYKPSQNPYIISFDETTKKVTSIMEYQD